MGLASLVKHFFEYFSLIPGNESLTLKSKNNSIRKSPFAPGFHKNSKKYLTSQSQYYKLEVENAL